MKNHLIFSNGIRKDFVALAADFCKELPFDIRNPMRYFLPIFVKYVGVRVREEKLDYVEHNKITRRDLDSIEGKLEMEIETPSGDRPSRP